jgi:Domain of unknown function (DUF4189)
MMTRRALAVVLVICATFGGIGDAAAQRADREWGALAFTQDGKYSGIVKYSSRIAASDKAMTRCEDLGHGRCEVVEVPGDSCVALATYVGPDADKRNRFSRSGVGDSIEVAERLAFINAGCEKAADHDNCAIKASFCADGRATRQTTDFVPPPSGIKTPDAATYYGAIAFTADGSWSTAWKVPSKPEAEAQVAKSCAKLGRGSCEVVSFTGDKCVALATFIGRTGRTRWRLSFTAGGLTGPEAQQAAMERCNNDERTRGRCQLRTMVCGDGR